MNGDFIILPIASNLYKPIKLLIMKIFKLYVVFIFSMILVSSCKESNQSKLTENVRINQDDNSNYETLDSSGGRTKKYDNPEFKHGVYTGTYEISNNERFQAVYSSQNYDTFYELYAKANFYKAHKDTVEYIKSFEFLNSSDNSSTIYFVFKLSNCCCSIS